MSKTTHWQGQIGATVSKKKLLKHHGSSSANLCWGFQVTSYHRLPRFFLVQSVTPSPGYYLALHIQWSWSSSSSFS